MTDLFDQHRVIDVDTHLTEPPDTWTRSFPASKHNIVPHIERIDGADVWMADGERLGAPGYYSMAGWDGIMPQSTPRTFDEIAPAMFDPAARLAFMDAERPSSTHSSTACPLPPHHRTRCVTSLRWPTSPMPSRCVDSSP